MITQNTNKFLTEMFALSLFCLVSLVGCVTTQGSTAPSQTTPIPPVTSTEMLLEGALVPARSAWLGFQSTGLVSQILVEEGQQVESGEPLARLGNPEKYQADLESARAEQATIEQSLIELKRQADLDYANALQAVSAALEDLEEEQRIHDRLPYVRGSTEQIAAAQANYTLVQDKVDGLQHQYNNTLQLSEEDPKRALALANLENAKKERDRALINLNWYKGTADEEEVAEANANLAAAQATLEIAEEKADRLENGPDPEQVALLNAQLSAAKAYAAAAQKSLDNLTIVAPFNGTIISIEVEIGEMTGAAPVIFLADLSRWYVETSDLDEIKVVDLEIGQSFDLIPDALPDLSLDGTLEEIGLGYQEQSGDVLYTARILVDGSDPRLRWGMTVGIRGRD